MQNRIHKIYHSCFKIPLICLLAPMISGCGQGESGPPRFALQGAVIYQGEAVPAGKILFQPDTESGNSGPGSLASIEDGKYELPRDKGVVGGAYILEVTGLEGQTTYDKQGEAHPAKEMFPAREIRITLPEGGNLDIIVPENETGTN